jgi:hypothetical protein
MTPQGRGKPKRKQRPKAEIPNAVIVTVTDNPDGRALSVGVTGNLRLTESPTLLRLAAKVAEQQLGLE